MTDTGAAGPLPAMIEVERAVTELRRGRLVVIEGQGEAALAQAAEAVTAESLALLRATGNGRSRIALTARRASVLNLPVRTRAEVVTLPLGEALDPAAIRWLTDPTCPGTLALPAEGAIETAGRRSCTCAAVRLSKLARLLPAAVTAPLDEPAAVNGANGLLHVRTDAIARYPRLETTTLRPVTEARVPLAEAENARVVGFRTASGGVDQFAIVIGEPHGHQPALCRVHSECFTGDLLGSLRCDCGQQLRGAIRLMGLVGHGVLLYLAHEGRGIGLINKLRAYQLQDRGLDTIDANRHLGFEDDERQFEVASVMLRQLGIARVRLLTNNPGKVAALAAAGIEVTERVPHATPVNRHNRAYLDAKARRAGHWLETEG